VPSELPDDVVSGAGHPWRRRDEDRARRFAARLPAGEETTVTQYLIAFNDEWVPEHTPEQLREKASASWAVIAEMKAAGVFLFTNGGIDASTAVCGVIARDGRPVFTDGPYVETKEHLGGFAVVDVADDEAARYWAGRLAVALDWPQEVHRFPGGGPSASGTT
jgi:hypothetical protein